ncbi:hypothetical protein GW17_00006123 [Ensete ventricosum]|nr:hypothetical protein GW17_00006123 [Ensete ventricosum]RZR88347.1 hypothetical protein BHM03_00015906 [Ensete ventricosum]
MAYDYPPEKLSIYVSDDGASELTFYALLEATDFVRHWISFCKRFDVEPRSPAAYFSSPELHDLRYASELDRIKIRVSSEISNSPVILNVDCDMYSNSSESVKNAMCFFLDEQCGQQIGYVQFPQNFNNLDKSNIYGDYISIINEVPAQETQILH